MFTPFSIVFTSSWSVVLYMSHILIPYQLHALQISSHSISYSLTLLILLVLDCFTSIWFWLVTMLPRIFLWIRFWVRIIQKRNLYMIWKAEVKQKPLFLEGNHGQTDLSIRPQLFPSSALCPACLPDVGPAGLLPALSANPERL